MMTGVGDNPFMTEEPAKVNPFLAPEPEVLPATIPPEPGPSKYAGMTRSERAKAMVADGKIGGSDFGKLGGAKRKSNKRATEVVAEAAADNAEAIKRVFLDGIDPSKPIGIRLQAAEKILKIEADQAKREGEEADRDFDNMKKGELIDFIVGGLSALQEAGQIANDVITINDADVVEDAA